MLGAITAAPRWLAKIGNCSPAFWPLLRHRTNTAALRKLHEERIRATLQQRKGRRRVTAHVRLYATDFNFAIVTAKDRHPEPVAMSDLQLRQLAHVLSRRRSRMPLGLSVKQGGVMVKRTEIWYVLWFPLTLQRVTLDFEEAQGVAAEIRDCLKPSKEQLRVARRMLEDIG